jgi:mRNA interferase RelE/StbE
VYRLTLDGRAQKDLDRLHDHNLRRVFDALLALQETPYPPGCKRLRGTRYATYRIRIGSYRAIYSVDETTQTITVWRVRHRKDVYR